MWISKDEESGHVKVLYIENVFKIKLNFLKIIFLLWMPRSVVNPKFLLLWLK
jgi:hypothetical protein